MKKRSLAPALAVVAVLAGLLLVFSSAGGEELLANRGFEEGIDAWTAIDAELTASTQANSGALAGTLTVQPEHTGRALQVVTVEAGQAYEFSGWVLQNDPGVERSFLRISWFNGADSIISAPSPWLVDSYPAYRYVTTGPQFAPPGADVAWATVVLQSVNTATATILLDDMSFQAVPGVTLTPGVPSPSPSPSSPPAETPRETATPRIEPTLAPTPTGSAPTATATQTANATQPPTPIVPAPTPSTEPVIFSQLVNGGFEEQRADGSPYGWRKIGGKLGSSGSPVRGGSRSLALTSGTTSTKWAYQTVAIAGGAYYEARVYAQQANVQPAQLFLRVSWYASSDGSGEAISSDDSLQTLAQNSASFSLLETGPIEAPPLARSARVRLMLRPGAEGTATAFFDDAAFLAVEAPNDTPKPTRTPSPTPTEAPTPLASGTPSLSPAQTPEATSSPTSPPTVTPTLSPTPAPTATAAPPEPDVFPALVNGDFEEVREDGTPYGWRQTGGAIAVTDTVHARGGLSLELSSETASTKWAHQAVNVHPGAYYEAAGWAMSAAGGAEMFFRVSWYASEDGSGEALGSADSPVALGASPAFQYLRTGAMQAPGDARSARVRLMLRPPSAGPVRAYFDDVSFGEVPAPVAGAVEAATPWPSHNQPPSSGGTTAAAPATRTPARGSVLDANSTPVTLANVRPAARESAAAAGSEAGGTSGWIIWPAILLPAVAIAGLLGADYVRGRRLRSE